MKRLRLLPISTLRKTISILLICLVSCKSESQSKQQENEIEHYIVGEWYSILNGESETIEDSDEGYLEIKIDSENTVKFFGKNQYYKENKYTSDELLKLTFLHTTGSFTMNFKISSEGAWSISKDDISFNIDFSTLDINFIGSDASNASEREIVALYREDIPLSVKQEFLENGDKPMRIVVANKTTLELEDNDNLISKYKRTSKPPKEFNVSLLPNTDFSEEQLKIGRSVFNRLTAMGYGTQYMLGAIIPTSDGIKLYNNPKLKDKSTHTLNAPKSGSQFDKALIVFDIIKDNTCGQHFKVLSKTGHFGWISGCSDIDTKWINIDEAFIKNQNAQYQKTFGVKDLKSVYTNQ